MMMTENIQRNIIKFIFVVIYLYIFVPYGIDDFANLG